MRRLVVSLTLALTLLGAAAVPALAAPGGTGDQEPQLTVSSVECTPDGVRVHFVLVHNEFTDAQLAAATLRFTYRVDGGATQPAMATAGFTKSPGGTAHFEVTLPGVTGTLAVTGGGLSIAGQTIPLHNTLTQEVDCAPPSA